MFVASEDVVKVVLPVCVALKFDVRPTATLKFDVDRLTGFAAAATIVAEAVAVEPAPETVIVTLPGATPAMMMLEPLTEDRCLRRVRRRCGEGRVVELLRGQRRGLADRDRRRSRRKHDRVCRDGNRGGGRSPCARDRDDRGRTVGRRCREQRDCRTGDAHRHGRR